MIRITSIFPLGLIIAGGLVVATSEAQQTPVLEGLPPSPPAVSDEAASAPSDAAVPIISGLPPALPQQRAAETPQAGNPAQRGVPRSAEVSELRPSIHHDYSGIDCPLGQRAFTCPNDRLHASSAHPMGRRYSYYHDVPHHPVHRYQVPNCERYFDECYGW